MDVFFMILFLVEDHGSARRDRLGNNRKRKNRLLEIDR